MVRAIPRQVPVSLQDLLLVDVLVSQPLVQATRPLQRRNPLRVKEEPTSEEAQREGLQDVEAL